MNKIQIKLWNFENKLGAIIMPRKTGIIYGNQTGGYNCMQSEMEGIIIPVIVPLEIQERFINYMGNITIEDMDFFNRNIQDKNDNIEIKFDSKRKDKGMEAWLPIIIIIDHQMFKSCILTWENSD